MRIPNDEPEEAWLFVDAAVFSLIQTGRNLTQSIHLYFTITLLFNKSE